MSRLLGPEPYLEPTRFRVHVQEHRRAGYRLTLEVQGQSERAHRSVDLTTCTDVQEAAAVLIATAIDAQVKLRAQALTLPQSQSQPQPSEERTHPAGRGASWWLTAGGVLDTHTLPQWSGGAKIGALWDRAPVWLWVEARHLVARRERLPDSAFDFEVDLFAGALGSALVWVLGPCSLGPSVEVEMGYLRGRGGAGDTSVAAQTDGGVWSSALLGAVAGYDPFRRFGMQLGLYAGGRLRPLRFALKSEGEPPQDLFSPNVFTLRVAFALRVALGAP